jgi:hypothetical protein
MYPEKKKSSFFSNRRGVEVDSYTPCNPTNRNDDDDDDDDDDVWVTRTMARCELNKIGVESFARLYPLL